MLKSEIRGLWKFLKTDSLERRVVRAVPCAGLWRMRCHLGQVGGPSPVRYLCGRG